MADLPHSKEILSAIALILTFAGFYPYVRAILRGQTRPHVFSWLIWGAGTVVVFGAQLAGGAGVGAWPIGVSGTFTILVALLALSRAKRLTIARMDWVFLVLGLSALPLWFLTSTPLAAVAVLTVSDLLGFGPSIRKAYDHPHEENAVSFGIAAIRNGFVVAALDRYSWTTALFPAAVGAACVLFVALILWRRRVLILIAPQTLEPSHPSD